MKKVIIDYTRETAVKVGAVAKSVSDKLYSAGIFAAPPVTKLILDTQNAVLTDAISEAKHMDREKLAEVRKQKAVLAGMLRELAEYVNTTVTDGDETKLLSSGFEIYKTPEKNQKPMDIKKIEAVFTNLPASIDLSWSKSKHAKYYRVFMSADNGQTWTMFETVFGRKMMAEQLVSGKRYQFKVVPVGLHGIGAESDVASQIAA